MSQGTSFGLTRQRHLQVLLLIVLAAGALRAPGLTRSLWYDEVFTATRIVSRPVWKIPSTQKQANNHVLFSLLAAATIGPGEPRLNDPAWRARLRLPALVAGVATVAVVGLAASDLLGPLAGLLAALLAAVSPIHVELSRQARGYSLLVLAVVVALWCYGRVVRAGGDLDAQTRRWQLGGALALGLAALSHALGLLVALAVFADSAWRRDRGALRMAGGGLAVAALAVAPIGTRLWRFAGRNTGVSGDVDPWAFIVGLLERFAGGPDQPLIALLVLGTTVCGGVLLWRQAPARAALARVALALVVIMVGLTVVFRPVLGVQIGDGSQSYQRFFVALVPLVWLLSAAAITGATGWLETAWQAPPRSRLLGMLLITTVLVAPAARWSWDWVNGPPEQDLGQVMRLAREVAGQDFPVVAVGSEAWLLEEYGAEPDAGQRPAVCVSAFAGSETDGEQMRQKDVPGGYWRCRIYARR